MRELQTNTVNYVCVYYGGISQKFFNRKYVMQEMYNEFVEGDEWKLPAVRYCFTNVFFLCPA
jgi:hypothetical protein